MKVTERKWTTKRGKPRSGYQLVWSEIDPTSGKRVRRAKLFAKKAAANDHMATLRVDMNDGVHVAKSKVVTVAEFGKEFLQTCRALKLEQTTIDGYEQHLRDHINPGLGSVRLPDLTVGKVREWQDWMRITPAENHSKRGHKGGKVRSDDMVRRVTITLGTMLADAVEKGRIKHNVVRSLKKQRGRRGKAAEERAKPVTDIPSPEAIGALLAASEGRIRALLYIAVHCGLRISELRGLDWSAIDFDEQLVTVEQRADRLGKLGNPKSKTSRRSVPFGSSTKRELLAWKLKQGNGGKGLAFANGAGNVESYSNLAQRELKPTMVKAGFKSVHGFHATRHFFASICLARPPVGHGYSLFETSRYLGHSDIALTSNLYGHLVPRDHKTAEMVEFG